MDGAGALHPETLAVVCGRPERTPDAPLNQPAVFASTYFGAPDAESSLGYGRYGNPSWHALEDAIGALEGGRALTFASGMAAAYAVLDLLPQGGTIVIPGNCYLGVSAAVDERARKFGAVVRRVDIADTGGVIEACSGAQMLWLESPANPTMEVADLPALGAAVSDRLTLVVDNTFATPILQRPLEIGAHVVLHSATKFMSGHSDAMMGALVCRHDDDRFELLERTRRTQGAVPGVMEAYLVLRGLRTLAVRLSQAQTSAGILAARLAAHPAVRRVRYPGLPSDPGHEVASRTMAGFGALLAIELADADSADALVEEAAVWIFATSLGGVESMFERRRRWPGELKSVSEGLIRMSVGIEHVEDLWADLVGTLDRLAGSDQ